MEIEPDTKDWTWVLRERCPECGLAPGDVDARDIGRRTRADLSRWAAVLERPDAMVRPDPATWSPTEYACHVRDVFSVFAGRITAMLDEHDPAFDDWDQDETAIADDYASQRPETVSPQLTAAGLAMADVLDAVPDDAWGRPGRRSNGSTFTVETLAQYYLHDVVHHLHDVDG